MRAGSAAFGHSVAQSSTSRSPWVVLKMALPFVAGSLRARPAPSGETKWPSFALLCRPFGACKRRHLLVLDGVLWPSVIPGPAVAHDGRDIQSPASCGKWLAMLACLLDQHSGATIAGRLGLSWVGRQSFQMVVPNPRAMQTRLRQFWWLVPCSCSAQQEAGLRLAKGQAHRAEAGALERPVPPAARGGSVLDWASRKFGAEDHETRTTATTTTTTRTTVLSLVLRLELRVVLRPMLRLVLRLVLHLVLRLVLRRELRLTLRLVLWLVLRRVALQVVLVVVLHTSSSASSSTSSGAT